MSERLKEGKFKRVTVPLNRALDAIDGFMDEHLVKHGSRTASILGATGVVEIVVYAAIPEIRIAGGLGFASLASALGIAAGNGERKRSLTQQPSQSQDVPKEKS